MHSKRKLVFVLAAIAAAIAWSGDSRAVPIDILTPGDVIAIVNGANDGDGDSGPPPAAEGVASIGLVAIALLGLIVAMRRRRH